MMNIILLAVSVGLTSFALNRLYVMAKYKAINVKGQHYGKTADPFQFWFFVGAACFMLFWGLATTVVSSAGMLGLL